ncbi:MAG TPA: hypothetical protein VFU22_21040 [Roseiflexaceae bacterium]|nr:hypothetical protein [Roseiflexaceae bacterium]
MSDFLDLMLARSYGAPANAVRPRPVARFELPDRMPALETPLDVPAADHSPVAAPMTRPEAAPTPASPPIETRELITTRELLTIRETTITSAPVAAEPAAAPIELDAMPHIEAKPIARASTAPRDEPAPVAATKATPVAPAPALPAQPVAAQAAPLIPRPHAEPRIELVPTTPVVRVRIGRVELHGPPPASPPRPPAPRGARAPVQPVRSLEDYLRRRNEER